VSAIALLGGLWRARRDGIGCDCDISLFETALHQLMYIGTWTASGNYQPRRMSNSAHPSIVPFQAFQTADGWITVACAKPKFWERLCHVLGRTDLLDDARFGDFAARDRHRDELLPILDDAFRVRTTEQCLDTLGDAGVPCGPVYDVAQALADRQTVAREDVIEIDHPRFGSVHQLASPLRVAREQEPTPQRRAPFRGEHTDEVLREVCEYTSAQVTELREAGAFGPAETRASPEHRPRVDTSKGLA